MCIIDRSIDQGRFLLLVVVLEVFPGREDGKCRDTSHADIDRYQVREYIFPDMNSRPDFLYLQAILGS